MGRDQERPVAPGEVRLQPLQRGEVEVVGGLVEQQQVRVIDQQPRQRDAGLLAARQLQGRPAPVLARHAEAAQRLLHALVQVIAVERLEPLPQARVLRALHGRRALPLQVRAAAISSRSTSAAPDRTAVRTSGAAGERLVEVRLLAEQPDAHAARDVDACRRRAPRGPLTILSSVVLPAPLAPTRPTRSPRAMDAADRIEDDEVADLAADGVEAEDAHDR